MLKFKATAIAVTLACMTMGSTAVLASDDDDDDGTVVDAPFSRIDADAQSGNNSGTVNADCSDYDGQYDTASASLEISQGGYSSKVKVKVKNGRPNTLYTLWVRMKGSAHGGANNTNGQIYGTTFGGSPITGGGATPLANTADLGQLVADWVGAGSPNQPNGFRTDGNGKGKVTLDLDFPVVGGAYPFNRMTHPDHVLAATKNPNAWPNPTAIVNPSDPGIGGPSTPFMIRMVSHCQDDTGHGLSPATREPWFQYP